MSPFFVKRGYAAEALIYVSPYIKGVYRKGVIWARPLLLFPLSGAMGKGQKAKPERKENPMLTFEKDSPALVAMLAIGWYVVSEEGDKVTIRFGKES